MYPDYPNNRIIVDGVDLTKRYQMVLLDGFTLSPPEPKTYTVDIPGGDGTIDLTEALMGDVAYSNRSQEFNFIIPFLKSEQSFEYTKRIVTNFLHGKSYDYTMTMDPGYTYHGRFTITDFTHDAYQEGLCANITVDVDAEPYKSAGIYTTTVDATGGIWVTLNVGRKKIHPTIKAANSETYIRTKSGSARVPPGDAYSVNSILINEDDNRLYLNSYPIYSTKWSIFNKVDSSLPISGPNVTWSSVASYSWDDLQRMNKNTAKSISWRTMSEQRWANYSSTHWHTIMGYDLDIGRHDVTIQYERKDL